MGSTVRLEKKKKNKMHGHSANDDSIGEDLEEESGWEMGGKGEWRLSSVS